MHVGDVEIVALIAPAFVEDLRKLRLRLKIHAQLRGQPAGSRSRWHAIRIDNVERRSSRFRAAASATAAGAAASARPIDQLVTVRANVVIPDAGNKRCRTTITQPIPLQRRAATPDPARTSP